MTNFIKQHLSILLGLLICFLIIGIGELLGKSVFYIFSIYMLGMLMGYTAPRGTDRG